jgi:predicted Fe-S protein YdhL (DUF1289 family)
MNKAVSEYMREMQRRSAESRWSGLSAAERSAKMKALRAKAKRKPKPVARRSNDKLRHSAPAEDSNNTNNV